MKVPIDRKYSETHEWFMVEDDVITMGITQHAADLLTDITYVELPEVGRSVAPGDAVGEVESVKATSDIFTAIAGKIIEVNTLLADRPELLNEDPFDEGWIARLKTKSVEQLLNLMDAKEYKEFVRNAG